MRLIAFNNSWKRLLALTLVMTLTVMLMPIQTFAADPEFEEGGFHAPAGFAYTITSGAALSVEIANQTVPHGTALEDLILPDTLDVTVLEVEGEAKATISGVSWVSEPEYTAYSGTYEFTPTLPEGYRLADGVVLPVITVTVQPLENVTIAEFDELDDYTLWQGYDYGEINSQDEIDLPTVLTGIDVDGNSVTIWGVTWQSAPTFDPNVGDTEYIFSSALPEGYSLADGVTAPVISVFIRPEGGFQIIPIDIEGTTATVSDLDGLKTALETDAVTEIIVSNAITLTDGTTLNGNGKTVRVPVTGTDAMGVANANPSKWSVFEMEDGMASISNMTILGGAGTNWGTYWGGAIEKDGGTLTLTNVTIAQSGSADTSGGGFDNYGGTMILKNCRIMRNVAKNGGGFYNGGTLILDGCTVSENRNIGTGAKGGGGGESKGTLYAVNTTFANNQSTEIGGGLNLYDSTAYLLNCSITGNLTTSATADYGGGVGVNTNNPVYIINSVVANNYYSAGTPYCAVSDISIYTGQDTSADAPKLYVYNSVYGELEDTNDKANVSNSKTTDTALFSGYADSPLLNADGTASALNFERPQLVDGAPLLASDSAALTDGTNVYFDYSDLTDIKVGYGTDDAITPIAGTATSANKITTYQDGTARQAPDDVIGAVGTTAITYYTVRGLPATNGTYTGATVFGDTYASGASVTVTATADAGYAFIKWVDESGTTLSTSAAYTFTVNDNVTLKPVFGVVPTVSTLEALQNAIIAATDNVETMIAISNDISGDTYTCGTAGRIINIPANKKITLTSAGENNFTITRANTGDFFYVNYGASLTLENITIDGDKNNTGSPAWKPDAGGSLVHVNGGALTMNSGATLQNNAGSNCGGVYIISGTITMSGGKISGNTSNLHGGGVCAFGNNITFTMTGGEISGNAATQDGGGICIAGDITFTMSGGKITGNTAGRLGGGVDVFTDTFILGGTADITGNTKDGNANNAELESGSNITFGTGVNGCPVPVTSGETKMDIGVTVDSDRAFTVADTAAASYLDCFTADVATKYIKVNGSGSTAQLAIANATYTATSNPASETFAAADYGYAAVTPQVFTIMNTGNHSLTNVTATLAGAASSNFEISTALSLGTIAVGDTVTVSVKPKDNLAVGTYSDTLQIRGDNGLATDVSLSFTVNNTAVAFNNLTANGTANSVDTTLLTLTFDIDITGLAATDITLSTGATKGTLTRTGTGVYTIAVSDITEQGANVTVTVSKAGFAFTPTNKTVAVNKDTRTAVTLNSVSANGTSGTADTTELTLTFSSDPGTLTASDITIDGTPGEVVKGSTVTGSGTTRVLAIASVTTAGSVTVSVSDTTTHKFTGSASTAVNKNTILPTLAQVTGATLSETGQAAWNNLSPETGVASYSIQLYKGGIAEGSPKSSSTNTGEAGVSFLSEMRAAGIGTYTVKVTAIGNGTTHTSGSASDDSSARTVAQLPTPTNPTWSGTNAAWTASNPDTSVSYYTVTVTGGGIGGNTTSKQTTLAVINPSDGASTFKVKAIAATTGLWLDSDESSASATYVAATYAITFNPNGGSVASTSSQTDINGKLASFPTPTRSGYTFNGWYTAASGGTAVGTSTIFTTNTTVYAQWTATGGGGGGYNPPTPEPTPAPTPAPMPEPTIPPSNVIVDGKETDTGTVTKNGDTTTVTVDQDKLNKEIENAKDNVTVVVPQLTGKAEAQLVVKNVEDMAQKDMTLTVQVGNVQYSLPTTAVDTAAVMTALGIEDTTIVPVNISVTTAVDEATLTAVEHAVQSGGAQLVFPPIDFKITAEHNGKTVEVTTFSQFVERTVEITAEQARNITTAIVIDESGLTRHVPTYVYQKDGKWYAAINSLTNSTYALIYNDLTFADAAGKWYEDAVNEMGSRQVISGIGGDLFAGERDITRAEFAAIIIRALGLPSDGDSAVFIDVPASAWYAEAVGKAYEYGLVSGVGNNLFAPDKKITRQEAMLMIRRAADIMKFTGSIGGLGTFTDADSVSEWALDAAKWNAGSGLIVGSNGKIRGEDNITRAETATLVLKLLQKAGLVDVRTPLTAELPQSKSAVMAFDPRKDPEPQTPPSDEEESNDE